MSCENQRQAFNDADAELTASIVRRADAEETSRLADIALENAKAADAAARGSLEGAEAAVTANATAADTAYTDYITCIQSGDDAPPIANQLPS